MLDFRLKTYETIIKSLIDEGFLFKTIQDNSVSKSKYVRLRHDVDKLPSNSLTFAIIEKELGIKGSYYFRIQEKSFDKRIINMIHDLGHEIGYHYEDLDLVWRSNRIKSIEEKEIVNSAILSFETNLSKIRRIAPVKSICMHGSPRSRWDNRLLWKYYDYKDFGIISEPYFDIDFSNMLYLTDTGRRWDGQRISIRDKADFIIQVAKLSDPVKGDVKMEPFEDWVVKPIKGSLMNMTRNSIDFQRQYTFHRTFDIINAINSRNYPEKIMMNFHPQRWTDNKAQWLKELILQSVKNIGKYIILKFEKI